MSAPDARCASAMTACDGYLPVPTISRDRNVRPAMTSGSDIGMTIDFRLQVRLHRLRISELRARNSVLVRRRRSSRSRPRRRPAAIVECVGVALDDDEVVLDGDAARVDVRARSSSALIGDGPASSCGSPFSRIVKFYPRDRRRRRTGSSSSRALGAVVAQVRRQRRARAPGVASARAMTRS